MGQTLSEPITTKETSVCSNAQLSVAASSMQGWRVHMEDAHSAFLHLPGDRSAALFAVFDGHGGTRVAQYAAEHLHERLVTQASYAEGDLVKAFKTCFLALDKEMLNNKEVRDELAGSTALVVMIKNGKIICANVGDSRAIASVNGAVQELSFDHKPNLDSERERIQAAGGWVDLNRVNGNLALSRALGDYVFKKNVNLPAEEQIVTANPDLIVRDLSDQHEFIVIACDGIWDVLSNQEVVNFVRGRLGQGMPPDEICEELMTRCLATDCHNSGLGCDNMTVLLICLLQGRPISHLAQRCRLPSAAGPCADILGDF